MLPKGEEAIHIFSADADRFVKLDRATIETAALNDASGDKDILVFRPFQTWTMCSAILCKAGSELGNTFHGHHDMQLQNDAVRKIMVGHYTFYSRAVVVSFFQTRFFSRSLSRFCIVFADFDIFFSPFTEKP